MEYRAHLSTWAPQRSGSSHIPPTTFLTCQERITDMKDGLVPFSSFSVMTMTGWGLSCASSRPNHNILHHFPPTAWEQKGSRLPSRPEGTHCLPFTTLAADLRWSFSWLQAGIMGVFQVLTSSWDENLVIHGPFFKSDSSFVSEYSWKEGLGF